MLNTVLSMVMLTPFNVKYLGCWKYKYIHFDAQSNHYKTTQLINYKDTRIF